MDRQPYLQPDRKLKPSDAVAALIVLDDGRYVMQLRDALPHIFYPGHWGCFGGAVEGSEEPLEALRRELREELSIDLDPAATSLFTRFDFELAWLNARRIFRIYYEVRISEKVFSEAILGEGAAVRAYSGEEILQQPRLVPYDAFAIWMHYRQSCLERP